MSKNDVSKYPLGDIKKVLSGMGTSVDDPIVIDSKLPSEISYIVWLCANKIFPSINYEGRMSAFTTFTQGELKYKNQRFLELEVEFLLSAASKDKKLVEKRRIIFDISKTITGKFDPLEDYEPPDKYINTYVDLYKPAKIFVPAQFGFCQFTEMIENEKGLGNTYQYGQSELLPKASLYIYNKGLDKIDSSKDKEIMFDEFSLTIANIKKIDPNITIKDMSVDEKNGLYFQWFLTEDKTISSLLMLTAINNHFIKFRLTHQINLNPEQHKLVFELSSNDFYTLLNQKN
ncbi:hypothetical protein PQZ50_02240 [Methylophilaceae bacterium]|nr:hypothetical protein [Methylophilaceae bacterium]